jgi:hypothetical protein
MPSIFTVGSKMYGVCYDCGKIVQTNKPIFGSVHICTTDEERRAFAAQISAKAAANVRALSTMKGAWQ